MEEVHWYGSVGVRLSDGQTVIERDGQLVEWNPEEAEGEDDDRDAEAPGAPAGIEEQDEDHTSGPT